MFVDETDEEQILTVTGRAPSLKICQELTLTMLTTRGARPATPRFERPAAAASRPQGASHEDGGRSPHGEATG